MYNPDIRAKALDAALQVYRSSPTNVHELLQTARKIEDYLNNTGSTGAQQGGVQVGSGGTTGGSLGQFPPGASFGAGGHA